MPDPQTPALAEQLEEHCTMTGHPMSFTLNEQLEAWATDIENDAVDLFMRRIGTSDVEVEYENRANLLRQSAARLRELEAVSEGEVEAAARAICNCDEQDGSAPWDYWPEQIKHGISKDSYRERARAALQAASAARKAGGA